MRRRIVAPVALAGAAAIWVVAQAPVPVGRAQGVQVPIFEYDPTFPEAACRRRGPSVRSAGSPSIGGITSMSCSGPAGCGPTSGSRALTIRRRRRTAASRRRRCSSSIRPARWCTRGAGPGQGYDWPQTEHGVFVDHKDVVWLAGSGAKDAQLLKFTREGQVPPAVRQARHERGQRRHEEHGHACESHGRSGDQRGVRRRRLRQPARHRARR